MENLYRIEENETTGWNLIDPQNDVKLTKEQATERLCKLSSIHYKHS